MFDAKDPNRILNFRPLPLAAVGLILGIAAFVGFDSLYSERTLRTVLLAAALTAVCAAFIWSLLKRKPGVLIIAACFILGAARALLASPPYVPEAVYRVSAVVWETPERENGYYTLCRVKLDHEAFQGDLRLKLRSDDKLKVGDEVEFTGTVKTSRTRFGAYNERLELLSKGISAIAECESIEIVSHGAVPLKRCFNFTRSFLKDRIDLIFRDNAGIVSGFLLGDKTEVDAYDMESFRETGTAHLLTLSGFHVGIIAAILFFILPKRLPALRFAVIGAFLLTYCAVASFAPSIVRASVMCMCMLLSDVTERRRDPLSALALSAVIILLFSPYMIYSVGFRLSFAATLGIILIMSAGQPAFKSNTVNKLISSILVTLGATVATSLISARYFNTFPTYGLIANFIAVPLFSVIITVSFILLLFGLVFPGAASVLAWVPERMIDGSMMILDGIRSLPYSSIEVITPSDLSCVLVLALMFTISAFVLRPLKKRVIMVVCVLLLFTASLAADIIRA
ncbi:MAG: ComEC/Rec2 family competence protein [Clostridia bacterium]|nr:ComEC/Rec2 family competence protein [Clostridia bacterium]